MSDQKDWLAFCKTVKRLSSQDRITDPKKTSPQPTHLYIKDRPLPTVFTAEASPSRAFTKKVKRPTIEARLDLHGYTQHQAQEALYKFLRTAQHHGNTWVLVITGKGGLHGGVLRQKLPT